MRNLKIENNAKVQHKILLANTFNNILRQATIYGCELRPTNRYIYIGIVSKRV